MVMVTNKLLVSDEVSDSPLMSSDDTADNSDKFHFMLQQAVT